ncbi:MAG TPA: pilus assembly protein N-terminal domain-containing protein [Bryobacteraceae bacterium]|nr:pilus assembly protein N-terminal domain-containing protein [Bryobacteraceae bacterium]
MKAKLRWSAKRIEKSLTPRSPAWITRRLMARVAPFALPVAWLLTLLFVTAGAQEHHGRGADLETPAAPSFPRASQSLDMTVGKSLLLDSVLPMERVSIGLGGFAEVTAVGPSEVLVSAKAPGETTLIIWQEDGSKLYYDLAIRASRFLANNRLELADRQIKEELPGQSISVSQEDDTFFLRGRVKDATSAERAFSIASTLGKAVNLLYVDVPAQEAQILLRVKFASVDRNLSTQLGVNLFSTGAVNTIGSVSTGQFNPPSIPNVSSGTRAATATLSDALNLFLFRPDLNLGATIKLLESRGLLEVLAEPNVLAQNGKEASFLAGGEFPFPVVQGSSGGGAAAVTIQFREFGVRLKFLPTITPRGSISLRVAPEVSALDFTHGLSVNGFNVPAMTVRKLNTSVELNEGQSFAIGGLLDNRVTETLEKIPFIGDLPVIGKFFQSRSHNKENTELLVIVTPEFVKPIPQGAPVPQLRYPVPFLDSNTANLTTAATESSSSPPPNAIPIETLLRSLQAGSSDNAEQPRPPVAPMVAPAAAPKN